MSKAFWGQLISEAMGDVYRDRVRRFRRCNVYALQSESLPAGVLGSVYRPGDWLLRLRSIRLLR